MEIQNAYAKGGDHMTAEEKRDTNALTLARRGLGLERFELAPSTRALRVELYRRQVDRFGRIVQWLPPAPKKRVGRDHRAMRYGRQWRWFDTGRLEGPWHPAFVRGG